MIKLPYGRADFGPMMREKCYYVDRTNYIEQMEVFAPVYTMFLRPRRFGKSLWISILEHYYDVNKAAEFQTFFGHLYIGQHKTASANQYRILRFDFSGIETNDVHKVHEAFLMKVKDGFERFMKTYSDTFTSAQQEMVLSQSMASGVAVKFFSYCEPPPIHRPLQTMWRKSSN